MPSKSSREDFIEKAKKVHGNLYDYSKVVYVNNKTKITIIDPIYGEFCQTPNSHLSGKGNYYRGLDTCKKSSMYNKEIFIEKAKKVHGDIYDYSKVVYEHSHKKVIIIDPEYGEFLQSPYAHLYGRGNPKRGKINSINKITKTLEMFIFEASKKYENLYDYSKVIYKNCYSEIIIIDPEHGEFITTPDRHLKGCGHPNRSKRTEYEIDHIIPISIIFSVKERKSNKFNDRPLYKFLNSEINLQKIKRIDNNKKTDKICFGDMVLSAKHFRNDYEMISKLVLDLFNLDISKIIEEDKQYVSRIKKLY